MPKKLNSEELRQQVSFVFKGTVLKQSAATMSAIAATNKTCVVRVDQIIQCPEILTDYSGQEITVQLHGTKGIKVGESFLFYTNGWVFGETLAVQSIAHETVPAAGVASLSASTDPVANFAVKESRSRFDAARAVVSGRVTAVRIPSEEQMVPMSMAVGIDGGASLTKPVSEHDPLIREAVVTVEAQHKGGDVGDEVIVRFPGSTDVRWYKAPKFRPGQQGLFMLHNQESDTDATSEKAPVAALMAKAEDKDKSFAVMHPDDFQPLSEPSLEMAINNLGELSSESDKSDKEEMEVS